MSARPQLTRKRRFRYFMRRVNKDVSEALPMWVGHTRLTTRMIEVQVFEGSVIINAPDVFIEMERANT